VQQASSGNNILQLKPTQLTQQQIPSGATSSAQKTAEGPFNRSPRRQSYMYHGQGKDKGQISIKLNGIGGSGNA
jgi:hypothetical protein